MSDIHGSGYGSDHNWRQDITDRFTSPAGGTEKGTRYYCRNCGAVFVHLYDLTPDIFQAMQEREIPEHCPGVQPELATTA